jgi:hypothetical protein
MRQGDAKVLTSLSYQVAIARYCYRAYFILKSSPTEDRAVGEQLIIIGLFMQSRLV